MFEAQNKRLSALAFYIDSEVRAIDNISQTSQVKDYPLLGRRCTEIRSLLAEAANSIRDARDIESPGPR